MSRISDYKFKLREFNPTMAYLMMFSLYLASVTVQTTTFGVHYPHFIGSAIQLMTILVMLVKIVFFDMLTEKQIIAELSLLLLVVIVSLISGGHFLITMILLVMGARNVDFRLIVKCYLYIVGSILLLAFIASELGIIQNIKYVTEDGLRQSFGVVYTTDFAAHLFYLVCAYLYVKAQSFRIIDFVPPVVATLVVYFFTKTMTDVIALIVLIVLFTLYIYRKKLQRLWLVRIVLRYAFLAMPIISVLIFQVSACYNDTDSFFVKANIFLSNRLSLGYDAIMAYGIKMLGQSPIYTNGWGGSRVSSLSNGAGNLTYFFIDSSYLNMLISYGILLTLTVVLGTSVFLYQRSKANDYLLPIIFVAIAISSGFDQHLLEVTYNVFFLMFFAVLPNYKTEIGPSFKKSVILN